MKNKLENHNIDEQDLDRKIESGEIKPVFIPKIATFTDIIKYQFTTDIIRYAKANGLKQVEIASKIDVNKSEISKMFSYNLKEFSQERILGFIEVLISHGAEIDMDTSWEKIRIQSNKLEKKLKIKGESKFREEVAATF